MQDKLNDKTLLSPQIILRFKETREFILRKNCMKNIFCFELNHQLVNKMAKDDSDKSIFLTPSALKINDDKLFKCKKNDNSTMFSSKYFIAVCKTTYETTDENIEILKDGASNSTGMKKLAFVVYSGLIYSEVTSFLQSIELVTQNIKDNSVEDQEVFDKISKIFPRINESGIVCIYSYWINSMIDEYSGDISSQKENFQKSEERKIDVYFEDNQGEIDVLKEDTLGCGLGKTMKLLRDRGLLNKRIEWAGRSMDKKLMPHQLLVKEAFFSEEEKNCGQIQRIEAALRRTDDHGRVLTAKEAFRELCYHFHGKYPSRNRQTKKSNQHVLELSGKHNLTTINTRKQVNKTLEIRQMRQSPYIIIEGLSNQ